MPVSSIASATSFDTAVTKAALKSDTTGFGSLVNLRAPGVDTDRGLDLAIAQQVTRGDRVGVLVDEGLGQPDAIRVTEQIDLVTAESLGPVERASFDSAGIVDDASAAGPAWFGRAAVGDITLGNAARGCLTGVVGQNSFSADTLVAFADGTMVPIADVQVGDQVLAYDFATGITVSRDVTATLPHMDWLLEAHFSDGSVMSVTEDHRFWSITDTDWVELQNLDTTDVLLTPDGATVTVDYLDWSTGGDAPAWDLTVAEEHNFFVAADESAVPVLVHNATRGAFCGEIVDPSQAGRLFDIESQLDDDVVVGLTSFFESGSTTQDAADSLVKVLSSASVADGVVIARNAQVSFTTTRTVLNQGSAAADVILGSARYEELVDVGFRGDLVAGVVRQLDGRPIADQRRIAANIFNSPEAAAMVELASRKPNDQLVTLLGGAAGVSPSDPLLVAEKLAELSDLQGSWDLVDDAFDTLNESFVNGLSQDTKDFIRGRRFDNRRASAFENNQVYLDTGLRNLETNRKVYVIVDSVDSGPPARIVSRKVSQIADVRASQIVRDLSEARTKYSPEGFPVADVPSRPAGLDAGVPLEGQLTLELPIQKIPTDAAGLASYNSKLATICEAAQQVVVNNVVTRIGVDVLDEAGTNLCPGN